MPLPAVALGLAGLAAAALAGCTSSVAAGSPLPRSRPAPVAALCRAKPGAATIRLTDASHVPTVTARVGSPVVVIVPRWGWGKATEVHVADGGILRQNCTVLLRGGGRRTIFLAAKPGRSYVSATVQPASDLAMPAWGGKVTVRALGH
ncbi:MAG TPA: hypothetical protein VGM14_26385 [Streptosporangiaceae bacterium]